MGHQYQQTGIHVSSRNTNNGPCPEIEKPYILGSFGLSETWEFEYPLQHLKYFQMPKKFPLDLNEGFDIDKTRTRDFEERLHFLLKFIYHKRFELIHKLSGSTTKAVGNFDFICYRGLLRLIMGSPYEDRQDWKLCAIKFKGNIYLCEYQTDQSRNSENEQTEYQKKLCYHGLKFEEYCITEDPEQEMKPTRLGSEWNCVFRTKLSNISLLYGAELDCVRSDRKYSNANSKDVLNNLNFVELKCRYGINSPRHENNFNRFNTRKWWCQCYLVGIEDILVGFRGDEGLVNKIENLSVKSLPVRGMNHWEPRVCLLFLEKFLSRVQTMMNGCNCPYTAYEYYFNPRSKEILFRIHPGRTQYSFLKDWYVNMLNECCS